MKISLLTENFKKSLNIVSHIVGKNQNLPILNNLLLTASNGVINLSTTNLEIGIKTTLRGKIEEEGSVTIPAKLLNDYINNLSSETVELTSDKYNLKIKAKNSHTKIKGIDPSEFPLLPDIDTKETVNVPIIDFRKALQQTIFTASSDSTRPELCSVLLKSKDDKLILAATDSYRLAEKKLIIEKNKNINVLIPQTTLQEVNRVFNDFDDGEIKIEFNDNQVRFSNESTFLISRTSEGQFPDYEQIIPTDNKVKIFLNTNEFSQAIRAASIFCRQGINDVKISLQNKKITISAVNDQVGESQVEIETETNAANLDIVFNYHYLLDVLGVVGSEEIILGLNDANLPGVIKPKDDDSYIYVIMPIKQ